MKTTLTIEARAYPVTVKDERTGEIIRDALVLDKSQLRAAQLVGQSGTELIYRTYSRQGYKVLEIGKPERRRITVNMEELYSLHRKEEA